MLIKFLDVNLSIAMAPSRVFIVIYNETMCLLFSKKKNYVFINVTHKIDGFTSAGL